MGLPNDYPRRWHGLFLVGVALAVTTGILLVVGIATGPLTKRLADYVTGEFGSIGGVALMLGLPASLALAAWWVGCRDARSEYARTRTIHVEKPRVTPTWAKVALGVQATLIAVALVAMILSDFK